ncbi:MAG TPA: branched-chain amino acid ABC transporter permease [Candidatus Dormibacteraeota bacterium]
MTTIYSGLVGGALYSLVAVGYNIVFVPTGTFNFAQAQFVMVGTFVAWLGLAFFHWPLALTIVIGVAVGGLLGLIEERTAIRLLPGSGVQGELVTTVGVGVVIEGLANVIFGTNAQSVPSLISSNGAVTLLNGRIFPSEILMIVTAVVVAILADQGLRRTRVGLASLATAEDKTAAVLRGINVGRLSIGAYMLAGGLCVAFGPFIASATFAQTSLGDALALKGFVALAIGGFGSQRGALIGGMTAGLLEAFVARYLNANFQNLAVLLLLLVVLTIRPHGLFGRGEGRVV